MSLEERLSRLEEKEVVSSSSIAMENDTNGILMTVVLDAFDHWVLDSMMSFHMMPNEGYFSFNVDKEGSAILMDNDATWKSL